MGNYTINTYEMKREIIKYSEKICESTSEAESKFTMDMLYRIFKSKNIHLSSIAEALNEKIKKAYTIDRLSDDLASALNDCIDKNYINLAIDSLGNNPVFIIDDSDITKPLGEKFEDLGFVRDGSSVSNKKAKEYYRCSSYKSSRASCTSHYITDEALQNIVLENIQKVISYMKSYEDLFIKEQLAKSTQEELRQISQKRTRKSEKKNY